MGIAIVFIFLYHSSEATCFGLPVLHYARSGTHAVNIFMLLSAFGLCHSYYRKPHNTTFLKHRFSRIFPTYWLVIGTYHVLAAILTAAHPQYGEMVKHPHSLVQSLYYYSTLGWWAHPLQPHVYYYDWYVPTIVFFYLLFPFMARWAHSTNRAATIAIAGLAAALACTWIYDVAGGKSFMFLAFTRFPIFTLGILIYYLKDHHGSRRAAVAAIVCLITIAIMLSGQLDGNGNRTCDILISTCAAMLYTTGLCVLLTVPMHISAVRRCFEFLGTLSLEIFLVHMIIIAAVRRFMGWEHWQVVVAFIISVTVAWLAHRAVEGIKQHINI